MISNTEGDGPSSKFGLESALDLQVVYPIVYPQTITIYQTNDHMDAQNSSQGFLDAFLNAIDGVSYVILNLLYRPNLMTMQSYCTDCALGQCDDGKRVNPNSPAEPENRVLCGLYKPANVISISYGGPEQNFPAPYQRRQCNEYVIPTRSYRLPIGLPVATFLMRIPNRYMKLGLQGVSVLLASGDHGVAGQDGCLGPREDIFSPTFPAKSVSTSYTMDLLGSDIRAFSCPYITAVGGTKVLPGHRPSAPETALYNSEGNNILSSGGGFSNVFQAPSYQQAAISK
jgi:tripeptidyl-peptidase-1